jgi:hypothetical protein
MDNFSGRRAVIDPQKSSPRFHVGHVASKIAALLLYVHAGTNYDDVY